MTQTTPAPEANARSIWDRQPELSIRLQELAALGLSFSKIATLMGLTRNQVISRSRRMGIVKSHEPQKANPEAGWMKQNAQALDRMRRERARQLARADKLGHYQQPASAPRRPASVDLGLDPGNVTRIEDFVPEDQRRGLLDLTATQCRWPIGDPLKEGFHFCHREQMAGLSYCESHARRSLPVVDVVETVVTATTVAPELIPAE